MSALLTGAVVVVYLLGYFPMARRMYIYCDNEEPTNKTNEVWAALFALPWPFVLIGLALKATVFRETSRQRKVRLDGEAGKVRGEAEKYGLPMPTVEVRPHNCGECSGAAFAGTVPRPHECPQHGVECICRSCRDRVDVTELIRARITRMR